MTRYARWAVSAFVLALLTGGCNRDEVTGLSGASANRAALPATMRNVILFSTDGFGIPSQLAVMQPDGAARRPVTTDNHGYLYPMISPDGRRIAASRFAPDGSGEGIYLMNADGSALSLLVNHSSELGSPFFSDFEPAWSPDGRQIAFASWVLEDGFGPFARIFVINVDGTGLRQLTPSVGPGDFAFDEGPSWSPDGTRIVFTRTAVLHVINVDGTGLTALPNEDGAFLAQWSPDGQRIAYQSFDGSNMIRIRNADGSNPVTVTTGGGPRWSPDGRRLAFARDVGGRLQVFVINVDGTGETRLSFGTSDNGPTWSPLPQGPSGAGAAIEITPTDAKLAPGETRQFTATVRTTNGSVLGNASVSWSSSAPAVATVTSSGLVTAVDNGVVRIRAVFGGDTALAQLRVADRILRNAIVYSTDEFGVEPEFAVVKPDGTGRRRLTTDQFGYRAPDVSPDGRQIAFATNFSIFVIAADAAGLTEGFREVFTGFGAQTNPAAPAWSPDGSQIAFRADIEGPFGPASRIFIVHTDGSGLRQVSPDDPEPVDDAPTWSPDGTRLIFTRNGVLHVINADGTGLTSLPNEDGASSPDWSPDGSRVAYASPAGGIRIRNADGSSLFAVTTGQDTHARWSPDSRQLVFVRVVDAKSQLFIVNADGTGQRRLSAGTGQETAPSWSPVP